MTIQTYVFYDRHLEPDESNLQLQILETGFDYHLPQDFSLTLSHSTYISGQFEKYESGFDFSRKEYVREEWKWSRANLAMLGKPDVVATFNTYSNAQEVAGMLIVASALTYSTGGIMYAEFFDDVLWTGKQSLANVKNIVRDTRESFSGPSSIRRLVG